MKHKVSELEGALLDAAVAKAERRTWRIIPVTSEDRRVTRDTCMVVPVHGWDKRVTDWSFFCPSFDWNHGGPLIQRDRISLLEFDEGWAAIIRDRNEEWIDVNRHDFGSLAPTPLVAAMRCYVASKFGDEVEL